MGGCMLKKVFLLTLLLASPLWLVAGDSPAKSQPPHVPTVKNVRVLATGGTIAGSGQGSSWSYRAGVVPIGDILRAVPGLTDIANVSAEQVANVGSYDRLGRSSCGVCRITCRCWKTIFNAFAGRLRRQLFYCLAR